MSALIAASIQMDAADVKVAVKQADHDNLPDDSWFLTLSVMGGYCTLSGTIEELRQLANTIADRANGA